MWFNQYSTVTYLNIWSLYTSAPQSFLKHAVKPRIQSKVFISLVLVALFSNCLYLGPDDQVSHAYWSYCPKQNNIFKTPAAYEHEMYS